MGESKLVGVRMNDVVYSKAEDNARQHGFKKTTGEANLSEYIRYLIIKDTEELEKRK